MYRFEVGGWGKLKDQVEFDTRQQAYRWSNGEGLGGIILWEYNIQATLAKTIAKHSDGLHARGMCSKKIIGNFAKELPITTITNPNEAIQFIYHCYVIRNAETLRMADYHRYEFSEQF